MLFATGRAGNARIEDPLSADADAFRAALTGLLTDLAQQIVRDGEGATKFVTIRVSGAASDESARIVGKAIGNSPLVKTALAGEDPNWGRVVAAIGKAGEPADRDRIAIRFGDILVAEEGWVSPGYRETQGAEYMKRDEIEISVELGIGDGQAVIWTCDLTHQYISINADYRS
jgi:glutamate N-acetyltransferase/amino-acid N-acetyltransferase